MMNHSSDIVLPSSRRLVISSVSGQRLAIRFFQQELYRRRRIDGDVQLGTMRNMARVTI